MYIAPLSISIKSCRYRLSIPIILSVNKKMALCHGTLKTPGRPMQDSELLNYHQGYGTGMRKTCIIMAT